MKKLFLVPLLLLGACTHTVYKDRIVTVNVPVVQACVIDEPTEEPKLREKIPPETWAKWEGDVDRKAAAVAKHVADQRSNNQLQRASTAACKKTN